MAARLDQRREFAPAPLGTVVRWMTILALGLAVAVPAVVVAGAVTAGNLDAQPAAWLSAGLPVVIGAIWIFSRVRGYRIEAADLVVALGPRRVRFPWAGLQSAEPDPQALRRALRLLGNGGLGSICGRFYTRRLGRFRAYVTDVDKAVVLRWPGRTVVVSPDRSQSFLDAARERIVRTNP